MGVTMRLNMNEEEKKIKEFTENNEKVDIEYVPQWKAEEIAMPTLVIHGITF